MEQDPTSTPWKAARQAWGLTQPEVATRAGIGQSYYSRVERGTVQPSIGVARRLWATISIPRAQDPEKWIRWFQEPETSPVAQAATHRLAGLFMVAHEGWALVGRTALGLPVTSKVDPVAVHNVAWWAYLSANERGLKGKTPARALAVAEDLKLDRAGLREWYITYWIDVLSDVSEPGSTPSAAAEYTDPHPPDPLWSELAALWPELSELERQAIVVLARRRRT